MVALGLLLLPWLPETVLAQRKPKTEQEWKVIALYNFTQFTKWPREMFPDTKAPFRMGIYGRDSFGPLLDLFKTKKVEERRIEVVKCSTPDEAAQCHLVFVSASEKDNLPKLLGALKKSSVLTVGETDVFLPAGGIINFWMDETATEKNFHFEIDPQAAKQVKLDLHSQLLSLSESQPKKK